MPELVRALQHPRDRVSAAVQRDLPTARLVLTVPDVEHAPTRRALDVPHLLQANILADVLDLNAAYRWVRSKDRRAVNVLPLWIVGGRLEQPFLCSELSALPMGAPSDSLNIVTCPAAGANGHSASGVCARCPRPC
jgi:hypothetical protein